MRPLLMVFWLFVFLGVTQIAEAEWKDWKPVLAFAIDLGISVGAERIRPDIPGDDRTKKQQFWDDVTNGFIDTGKDRLQSLLKDAADVSDSEGSQLLMKLREEIDEKTTRTEYLAMVERMNSQMAQLESKVRDMEYEQSRIERKTDDNTRDIRDMRAVMEFRQREFEKVTARIDLELAEIRGRVADLSMALDQERVDRIAVDLETDNRLDRVEHHLDPETRSKTAAIIAAIGSNSLVNGQDPVEAARVLQLAIAYDKVANMHADPGSRYFLAIAYRRMGEHVRADEMISEAIVAERYRKNPEWYHLVIERFQGEDRRWVDAKRYDPRFGVRAPRRVLTSK